MGRSASNREMVSEQFRFKQIAPYLIQIAANAGLMMGVVYVPFLARDFGASTSQVGLLVAIYQATMFLSNLIFGRMADYMDRKPMVLLGLGLSAVALGAHMFTKSLEQLFLVRAAAGLAAGVFPSALIAYFYQGSGYDRPATEVSPASTSDLLVGGPSGRDRLGRFSGFGALGWGVGALLAGWVTGGRLFLLGAVLLLAALMAGAVGLMPQRVYIQQAFLDLRVLKRNWTLYLSFYLRHTGAHSIWAIFPVFIRDLGASMFWVGAIFAINPFGQFILMNVLEKIRPNRLIGAGLIMSMVTFVAFALARDYRQLIPIQVLLALSWSSLYLGSIKQLMDRNEERSTAAGLFQSVFSLAAVSGGLLTGITGQFGYPVVMLTAAGLTLAGIVVYAAGRG